MKQHDPHGARANLAKASTTAGGRISLAAPEDRGNDAGVRATGEKEEFLMTVARRPTPSSPLRHDAPGFPG